MTEIHGQWRTLKYEVQDSHITPIVLEVPVLVDKGYARGYHNTQEILATYRRALH